MFSADRRKRMTKPQTSNLTLNDLAPGIRATVRSVKGGSALSKRLMEMGVVPGVSIRIIKSAPFGDPIEIRLRGYSLAIRRNEAAAIEIDPEPEGNGRPSANE
jgi:ferrous iron transport protein A